MSVIPQFQVKNGEFKCLVASVERLALSKSLDTAATVHKGLFGVSQFYILSVKRLLLFFGALHAKVPGPSCPIMMHHHQINMFLESVGCLRTTVPESIIELNQQHYILT